MASKRLPIPLNVKLQVLHEAGYRCSVPTCRTIVTLDMHHCDYVSNNGSNDPANLLVLCPNCHSLHHKGLIPDESIRAWKMFQISLNEALDNKSINILLTLNKLEYLKVSGEGIRECSSLVASEFIRITRCFDLNSGMFLGSETGVYEISLTDRGSMFVDAWKRGDQASAMNISV